MRSGNTTEYRALLWATTERAAPTASAAGGAFSALMSRYWPKATSVVMRAKARRAARLVREPTCAQASAKASVAQKNRRGRAEVCAVAAPSAARVQPGQSDVGGGLGAPRRSGVEDVVVDQSRGLIELYRGARGNRRLAVFGGRAGVAGGEKGRSRALASGEQAAGGIEELAQAFGVAREIDQLARSVKVGAGPRRDILAQRLQRGLLAHAHSLTRRSA